MMTCEGSPQADFAGSTLQAGPFAVAWEEVVVGFISICAAAVAPRAKKIRTLRTFIVPVRVRTFWYYSTVAWLAAAVAGGAAGVPSGRAAGPVDALVAQAEAAEARLDPAAALALYTRAEQAGRADAFVWQKISKQESDLSDQTADRAEKLRLLRAALDHAQRAVAMAPRNAVDVLSVAICHGKLAQLVDARTQVEYSRRMYNEAERALQLDPNYSYAHHVLGRWNYEVATLGAGKRFLARLLYGGLPEASLGEAIRQLQTAVRLAPDIAAHRVELGFALLAAGRRADARAAFVRALALRPREIYDVQEQRRARQALADLG